MEANRDSRPGPETPSMGLQRQRPRIKKSVVPNRLSRKPSGVVLSPTAEERSAEDLALHVGGGSNKIATYAIAADAFNKNAFDRPLESQHPRDVHCEGVFEDFEAEGYLRHRPRSRQEISVCEGPEVSMEDIPPRTSSKQCLYVENSLISQSTHPAERADMEPAPRTAERHAHSLGNEKENQNPILSDLYRGKFNSHDSLGANLHGDHREATRRRNSRTSQGSQITYDSEHRTVETINRPKNEVDSEAFDTITKLTKETVNGHAVEAVEGRQSLDGAMSSAQSRDSQDKEGEVSFLPPRSNMECGISSHGLPDLAPPSIDSTPKTLYALTRMPILPRENGGHLKAGQGHWMMSSNNGSESEVRSRRVGVKAMAAMFEGQEKPKNPRSEPKYGGSGRISTEGRAKYSPSKSVHASRSGPLWEDSSPQKTDWSTRRPTASPNTLLMALDQEETIGKPTSRKLASHSAALRAAEITNVEKRHETLNTERPLLSRPRRPLNYPEGLDLVTGDEIHGHKQRVPSLGTMGSHQEQPPIAQHLNLIRPPVSPIPLSLNIPEDKTSQNLSALRSGSTTSLHTQICHLQRQLDVKTEEALQLRRQLEAQDDLDVGALSEQLREVKREVQMWKERAEVAERRVKVFKKLTVRTKDIQEAAEIANQQRGSPQENPNNELDLGKISDRSTDVGSGEQHGSDKRTVSEGSRGTEDVETAAIRIRECLEGSQDTSATAATQDEMARYSYPDTNAGGSDGESRLSGSGREAISSMGATEIWMAAQDLLRLE